MAQATASLDANELMARYRRAKQQRALWEALWQDCYDFALPQRTPFAGGDRRGDRLFDGTAADAAEQLAASLMSQLVPPWSRWFGLQPGDEVPEMHRTAVGEVLERAASVLQGHFDRSNFAMEVHQCFLDLVVVGTATLQFEEAPLGGDSAFRFTAVPVGQMALDESADGAFDVVFRASEIRFERLQARFPKAQLPASLKSDSQKSERRHTVIEATIQEGSAFRYTALLEASPDGGAPVVLAEGQFAQSPFLCFRWLKAPGEVYGRSPVMKALPDIKTANKVVELVLKNASIAVTGIWQADDDGVLNPANVKLQPGTIIPKAVGSAGLTPLEAPGRFDVSNLVLEDLRGRIRHAMLADRLGQIDAPKMTATEVMERAAEMSRVLGATYGRLQTELLTPLVSRALAILRRRGEIPPVLVDGQTVDLQYKSPLARIQAQDDVRNAMLWVQQAAVLGPEGQAVIDAGATARWMARALSVPADLVRPPNPLQPLLQNAEAMLAHALGQPASGQ
jgi:hypothetical protein